MRPWDPLITLGQDEDPVLALNMTYQRTLTGKQQKVQIPKHRQKAGARWGPARSCPARLHLSSRDRFTPVRLDLNLNTEMSPLLGPDQLLFYTNKSLKEMLTSFHLELKINQHSSPQFWLLMKILLFSRRSVSHIPDSVRVCPKSRESRLSSNYSGSCGSTETSHSFAINK